MNYPSLRKILRESLDKILVSGSDATIRVRPSNLGSCPRRIVLSAINGVEEDSDISSEDNWGGSGKGVLVVGKIYEGALKKWFEAIGFLYQCYIVIDEDLYGHCDFYLPPQDDGVAIVVDLKTTGKNSIPFLPNPSHINQVQLYMHGVLHGEIWKTDDDGNPIEKLPNPQKVCGALLYIIREDPYFVFDKQEYWVSYNSHTAAQLINYARKIKSHIEKGEIPDIPSDYSPFHYPCYYANMFGEVKCPFWDNCWQKKIQSTDSQLRAFADEMIEAYKAYKKAEERYEALKKRFKDMISDYPKYELSTAHGTILKYTETKEIVNYRGVIQDLVGEGLVSEETMRALIERHTKIQRISGVKVSPKGGV